MKIFGLTVGKNERRRYLLRMIEHHANVFDEHFYYDDQSDDISMELAALCGATSTMRPNGVPSFVEDEGAFREAAWRSFEEILEPTMGDYVVVVDCDEFLVTGERSDAASIRTTLHKELANLGPAQVMTIKIPEVFGVSEHGQALIRKDKLWGTIFGIRIIPYLPSAEFIHGDFGVPPVPSYAMGSSRVDAKDLFLMHYGYATQTDRETKYARYHGRAGHGSGHVESILEDPELEPWNGQSPVN